MSWRAGIIVMVLIVMSSFMLALWMVADEAAIQHPRWGGLRGWDHENYHY